MSGSATDDFAALVFKYRGLLWGIFALLLFVFPVSFSLFRTILALPLLIAGQGLRFWAAGVIPKYRTLVVGAPKLVRSGPYALVRNPLYAGNGLMGIGWALMAGWWWIPAFALLFCLIYVAVIIPREEHFLLGTFKDEYVAYRSAVPALLPKLDAKSFAEARHSEFDAQKSWSMERHSLYMNIAVTAVVLVRLFVLKY